MKLKMLSAAVAFALSQSVLAQSAAISGSVKDTRSFLPGAKVTVEGTELMTQTNNRGEFTLLGLEPGTYEIKISYIGYEPKILTVVVEADQRKNLGTLDLNVNKDTLEEQVVVGSIIQGEMRALNVKRNSTQIVDAVSADAIGKLPDRNAAEAVQRLPGIAIERDQGEGRFVAIRGLPAEWSTNSINGDRLPTAEEETTSRATAFDFFPTEMIELVEVSKSVTANMEGDAIGGNVNFITRTAPAERTLKIGAGVNYNENADKLGYQTSILYGDLFADGKFGILMNFTNWQRSWATDNYEPRRGDDGIGIRRLELRDYTGTRDTYGANLAMEYNFDNGDQLFLRGLYGTLEDDEVHYKHRYRFDKDRVEVQNIHNVLKTQLWGAEFGGFHIVNTNTSIDWKLSTYENTFKYGDSPNSEDNAYFVARFDQNDVGYEGLRESTSGSGKMYSYNEIDGGNSDPNAPNTHLPAGFSHDPNSMELAYIELYKVDVKEKDNIVAQFNFTNEVSDTIRVTSGAKYRDKTRNARFSDEFYVWDEEKGGPTPVLADFPLKGQPNGDEFLNEVGRDYSSQFSPVVDMRKLEQFWNNNKENFVLDEGESATVENGGALGRHFDVYEDQLAAYGMVDLEIDPQLSLNTGLRLEYTKTEVDGKVYETNEDTGQSQLVKNNQDKDYLSVLPSVHLAYLTSEESKLRASATRTFARPNFGDLSPGGTYMEVDNKFTSGNPQLDPTYSTNLDLMWEYYFANVGLASAGVFYKHITDPIFKSSTLGTYRGNTGVTFIRPENGGDAWLAGLELTINHRLDFIHPVMEDFGFLANYTYMESRMSIEGRSDDVAIPQQANNLFNFQTYYDNGIFSARVAINYKGSYITEYGDNRDTDAYYGAYMSVDFNTQWQVTDQFGLYLEASNLTNEPLKYYIGSENRPLQVEYYGVRGQVGFTYDFF